MRNESAWKEFFDAHAPFYDQNEFTRNTGREIDFLLEELLLPHGASILDVGCGTGRHAIEFAKRGFAVTGLDLSSSMLAKATEKANSSLRKLDRAAARSVTHAHSNTLAPTRMGLF